MVSLPSFFFLLCDFFSIFLGKKISSLISLEVFSFKFSFTIRFLTLLANFFSFTDVSFVFTSSDNFGSNIVGFINTFGLIITFLRLETIFFFNTLLDFSLFFSWSCWLLNEYIWSEF